MKELTPINKDLCPKKYCFFFVEHNDYHASGLYENLEAALFNLQLSEKSSCDCSFGRCTRIYSNGDRDWYEPCEPTLDQDNLPYDYFIKK